MRDELRWRFPPSFGAWQLRIPDPCPKNAAKSANPSRPKSDYSSVEIAFRERVEKPLVPKMIIGIVIAWDPKHGNFRRECRLQFLFLRSFKVAVTENEHSGNFGPI